MTLISKMPPKGPGRSNHFQTLNAFQELSRLAPYIPKDWTIWEPACGQGFLVDALRDLDYSVHGTDISGGFDFTDPLCPQPEKWDMSLTNAPFSIKDKWLRRCYDLGKPFALLLPITALGEQDRVKMYKKHGIQVALPPERIEFKTPNGTEGGSWFYSAWFCYGLNLPRDIFPLD